LNGNFKVWCPKSAQPLKTPEKGKGKNFDFSLASDYFATPFDIKEIAEGKSSTQIVDTRADWSKGNIAKSKHLSVKEVFWNSQVKDAKTVIGAFKKAEVDLKRPIIFMGGSDAYVLKAVSDHIGATCKTQVFQMSYEEWLKYL